MCECECGCICGSNRCAVCRRVDFRNLVRELYTIYDTRIWMSQVDAYPSYNRAAKEAMMTGIAPEYDMGNEWVEY